MVGINWIDILAVDFHLQMLSLVKNLRRSIKETRLIESIVWKQLFLQKFHRVLRDYLNLSIYKLNYFL